MKYAEGTATGKHKPMNIFTAYCVGISSFIAGGVYLICHDYPVFGGILLAYAILTEASHNTKKP